MDSYRQFKQTNRPIDMSIGVTNERRRRGRQCALERQNNELLQAQLSSMVSQSQFDFDSDFAKLNILPFITRRQRRARANDIERCRMQRLNEELDVLKSMLPIDYLLTEEAESDGQRIGQCQSSPKLTKIYTLKLATKYIRILTELLNDNVSGASGNVDSSPVWSCSNTVTDSSSVESLSPSLAPFVPTYSTNYAYSSSSLYFNEPTKYTSYATLQSEQHQLINQSQSNSLSNPIY